MLCAKRTNVVWDFWVLRPAALIKPCSKIRCPKFLDERSKSFRFEMSLLVILVLLPSFLPSFLLCLVLFYRSECLYDIHSYLERREKRALTVRAGSRFQFDAWINFGVAGKEFFHPSELRLLLLREREGDENRRSAIDFSSFQSNDIFHLRAHVFSLDELLEKAAGKKGGENKNFTFSINSLQPWVSLSECIVRKWEKGA